MRARNALSLNRLPNIQCTARRILRRAVDCGSLKGNPIPECIHPDVFSEEDFSRLQRTTRTRLVRGSLRMAPFKTDKRIYFDPERDRMYQDAEKEASVNTLSIAKLRTVFSASINPARSKTTIPG
ncbi:hypothetical protein WA026_022621 [Henosepilachna vigintioctopunctata]|uniref:Uncharacterized protein n=1 Tax=Henosepilachna vigintioctopunctata TaxID=420089 RepID=A0AAW1V281_9CUCU